MPQAGVSLVNAAIQSLDLLELHPLDEEAVQNQGDNEVHQQDDAAYPKEHEVDANGLAGRGNESAHDDMPVVDKQQLDESDECASKVVEIVRPTQDSVSRAIQSRQ